MMDEVTAIQGNELPHSIEAEQCVLGAVISDPSVLPQVIEKVRPDYFFSQQHKEIYSVIQRMFTAGQPIDIITILDEIEKLHIFESAADARKYLASIADMLPSTLNVDSYCKIVADRYYLRSLSYVARDILEMIQSGENDASMLMDSAEQKIYDIRQGRSVQGLVPLKDLS